jgi:hypothetical protein
MDIAILNARVKKHAVVFARRGSDFAVAELPTGTELKKLLAFRDNIFAVLFQNKPKPSGKELTEFGHSLFNYIFRDDVKTLYDKATSGNVIRLNILTNRADLQSLPWEYLQDPKQAAGPPQNRFVVRIPPRSAPDPLPPLQLSNLNRKLKLLFVYADPQNLDPVSWTNVLASKKNALEAQLPKDKYEEPVVIEGTLKALFDVLQHGEQFDIFHFSGHGDVDANQEGRIFLLGQNNNSHPLRASVLAGLLTNTGIRLAILSACMTAAGNAADPFNVVAEALVLSGIPAVVANMLPVPDSSVAAFVGELYAQLLITGDIDIAVSKGRLRLSAELDKPPDATLEWGIPTLYRHIAGAKVFVP